MDQKKIGAFLKQLRNEKGLTQEELSEKFYVSSKTVSRWETGSNMPDLSILIELSEFYEIDIRELIDGERRKTPLENDTNDALKKAAEYSKEERKMIVIAFDIKEYTKLLDAISKIDPRAFVTVTLSHEVNGEGFASFPKSKL